MTIVSGAFVSSGIITGGFTVSCGLVCTLCCVVTGVSVSTGGLFLSLRLFIAVITDIERDVNGRVAYITVSESNVPFVIATRFTPEEFRGYWLENDYFIYRRDDLDRITYTPSPYVHLEGDPDLAVPELNRSLQPHFGNKANYMLGEEV